MVQVRQNLTVSPLSLSLQLVFIAFSALAFVSLRFGLGKHNETVAPADRVVATKFAFIASVIYIALSYLVKVIVGLFLVRICSGMFDTHKTLLAPKVFESERNS